MEYGNTDMHAIRGSNVVHAEHGGPHLATCSGAGMGHGGPFYKRCVAV